MRSRNIKPGFFLNEQLAELSFQHRLLFIGLWCYADREGRFEVRPMRLKMTIFPADEADIPKMLNDLTRCGLIEVYSVSGVKYCQIINFLKHQSPHFKEAKSKIPAKESASTNLGECLPQPSTETAPPDILIPDTLIPDTLNPDKNTLAHESVRVSALAKRFERWYSAYPKKKNRGDAEKAWKQIKPDEELTERMIEAVNAAKKSQEWQKEGGQFIPYPGRWLRAKGWEDEIGTTISAPKQEERPDELQQFLAETRKAAN